MTRPSDRIRSTGRVDTAPRGGVAGDDDRTPSRPSWSADGQRDVRGIGGGSGRTQGRPNPLDLPAGSTRGGGRVDYGRGPVQRLANPRGASLAPTNGRPGVGAPTTGAPDRGRPDGPSISTKGRRDVRSIGGGGSTGTRGVRPAPNRTNLGDLQQGDPRSAARIRSAGRRLDQVRRIGLGAGLSAIGGVRSAAYRGYGGYGGFDRYGYYNPWGFSCYNGNWSFRFGYNWYWGDCWWYWPCYVSTYYPWWYATCRPYYYSSWYYPTVYSSVVYRTVYTDVEYIEEEEEVVVEEAPAGGANMVPRSEESALSIAAERYLTLGDRAFRESRWADAVQLYAKAVELAPENAGLFLVLADALFAAGDYHYAAYAIRKAVELDPVLLSVPIDKHGFYSDPDEFDRQIARLETYVIERPTDRDARLVLAVNLLFGNRPAGAVDLYAEGSAPAAALAQDDAVRLTLESARSIQYGQTR